MERKIGEIFEFGGEWYQCVEGRCKDCHFSEKRYLCKQFIVKNFCLSGIIFKKLEKVGEPYEFQKRTIQTYKLYTEPFISVDMDFIWAYVKGSNTIDIIIKRGKEDMEEKKLNLKTFDLQKAKEGKPVCTRDGRKARIICFDRNDLYPIVALIECEDGKEIIGAYSKEGQTEIYEIKGTNLLMLPEKRSGWINIYKGGLLDTKSYSSKEEAVSKASQTDYIDTIKIEWEE